MSLTYYVAPGRSATDPAANGAVGPGPGPGSETGSMFACLILGDSLAQGTASELRAALNGRCSVVAARGVGSGAILRAVPNDRFATAAISAGSNDATNPHLADNLIAIRRRLSATRVVWIAPYNRAVAWLVADLARSFGDSLVDVAETPPVADGLHPQNYRRLAQLLSENGFAGR